jgi:DNA polymerase-3 subunit epsilon
MPMGASSVNALAATLVGSGGTGPARGDYTPLGLGRSVFGLLERDQVAHALDKIHQQIDRKVGRPHTRFVTGAANGAVLRVHVAPFLSGDRRVAGMVFTLDDVSGLIGREGQRLKLLQAFATGMRAPVANLRAIAESLVAFPDMEVARRSSS